MPFAAKWMDLEIIILSELSHPKKDKYGITYMCNLKYDTNELIYKTDSRFRKQSYGYQRRKWEDKLGVWD